MKNILIYGTAVSTLLALLVSDTLITYIWPLVNIFAAGRSPLRVYLFGAYTLLLLALYLFTHYKGESQRLFKLIIIGLLSVSFLGNFFGYIYITSSNKLPYDFFITINNGEITSNQLTHSHVAKGGIGSVVQKINKSPYENADIGTAMVGLLPSWFFLLTILVTVTTIILSVYYYYTTAHYNENTTKNILYLVLYSILSFSVIEHVVDGGILADHSLLILGLFIALLYKEQLQRLTVIAAEVWMLHLGFILLLGQLATWYELLSYVYGGLAILTITIALFYHLQQKNIRLQALLYGLAIVSLFPVVYGYYDTSYSYRTIALTPQTDVIIGTYQPTSQSGYEELFTVGNLHYYKTTPQLREENVGALLKKFNLLDNLYPISVSWETCMPTSRHDHQKFTVASKKSLTQTIATTTQHYALRIKESSKDALYRYEADLYTNPCLPRVLNLIDELVKQRNEPIFIYNIK